MQAFALKQTTAAKLAGKNVWFRYWSPIGPCSTPDEGERALFHTREDATDSPAFKHPLNTFEVYEVDAKVGNFNWKRS